MDSSKIKNILILVLLLVNAFFLAVLIRDGAEERRSQAETAGELRTILEGVGITADQDLDFFREAPKKCTLLRDSQAEQRKVGAILGSVTAEDLGGNILYYSSASGKASLRGTGEMDMIFSGGSIGDGGKPERAAVRLLNKAGFDVDESSASVNASGENSSVTLCFAWEGYPIYNARVCLDYSGGRLQMLTGTRPFDTVSSTDAGDVMNCVSAVMRFVELVKSDGLICSRLEEVEPGYIMSVEVSGESDLTPVWKIVTDTGNIYINALTGKTETVQ
ncbi:MAG: hypothetical protein ACI4PC_06485 [Oscillospiraceae bacterium]